MALRVALKTPKGTKDWCHADIRLRDHIFATIAAVFAAHGAVPLDTPVFERSEILAGKYGQDAKLIYNLQDQGGELCSLRYDLTVPFARWLAMNNILQIKRYHIAKVYRRDQPAIAKGRLREFYQCDFDIAGSFDPMIPDAEIIKILCKVLADLDIGSFTVKLNHRKLLDGIFQICGVPDSLIRPISSALPWDAVRNEMILEKGLDPLVADKIASYVKLKGGHDLLEILERDPAITSNPSASAALKDLGLLFNYLAALSILDKISFDLSLARGLDYYTGIIYEAVTQASQDDSIGSVAAGGRYDDLVGMFANKPNTIVPCVGISIGVERVFSILKSRTPIIDQNSVQVYVMAFGGGKDWTGFIAERLSICNILWDAGIKAELLYKNKPKPRPQFEAAERGKIPLAVILGQSEYPNGQVRVKKLGLKLDSDQGDLVNIGDLVQYLLKTLTELKL
ncbi:Histidine--tRNA ligase, mitochondrial [Neolecta irregularis DAH-3]|uniref:histidine--tRNA ligase n=1 Tax=Neolecta irregularis (strain DAH-3) TaxID=1198029 RepID=A0A1U7LJ94_NEOID|nr:Histidine--tRNA ligase, mitochondrial [Neolecta irregularis DAH-3]|eukprot:OLL22725.1 Histidine--tRNA ligase, mitochondrial [Neolecta irregularis DAH-3]